MNRRNSIILLLSGLILLLSGSIVSTLAWYVEGADLFVNYVSIEFAGEKKLLISTNDQENSFKESLSKDDLKKVDKFTPVSSAESNYWLDKKEEVPQFVVGYNGGEEPQSIIANSGFFSQELYLLSEDDIYATLDKTSFQILPNNEKNAEVAKTLSKNFPDLSVDEITNNLNNINKSLRISILIPEKKSDIQESNSESVETFEEPIGTENSIYSYFIVDPYKDKATYLGGIMDSNADGYYDEYDDVNFQSYQTVYGDIQNRDKLVYDPAPTVDEKTTGLLTCFNANRKKGVKQFNLEKSIENGVVIPTEDSLSLDEVESKLQIPIDSYEPRKIVLSIYLEGWDLDNTNLVSYASFLIDIKFKISKVKEMS